MLAVVDALCDGVADPCIHGPGAWLPDGDPHRHWTLAWARRAIGWVCAGCRFSS
jgi:hypothetical protein